MKIYLATWLVDESLGNSLTKVNGKNRLLSYYFLQQTQQVKNLKKYIKTGKLKIYKKVKNDNK